MPQGSLEDCHVVEKIAKDRNPSPGRSSGRRSPWARPRSPSRRSPVKGDPDVIEMLNAVLTSELTAINQYFIHYKMCENWGYKRLSSKKRHESIDEMKHADRVIERILFLDGTPNMQRLSPVRVGEHPIEQHEVDLAL